MGVLLKRPGSYRYNVDNRDWLGMYTDQNGFSKTFFTGLRIKRFDHVSRYMG